MAWGTVSITFGGILTVLSAPLGYALLYVGSAVGGAGFVRDELARHKARHQ